MSFMAPMLGGLGGMGGMGSLFGSIFSSVLGMIMKPDMPSPPTPEAPPEPPTNNPDKEGNLDAAQQAAAQEQQSRDLKRRQAALTPNGLSLFGSTGSNSSNKSNLTGY